MARGSRYGRYDGGPDPTRLRVMLRMTLEDGW